MNVKNCGKIMERHLNNFFGFKPNMSDFGSDVSFLVYDEYDSRTTRALGGDYESSITFTISRWKELSVEIYFSNARARVVAPYLPRILRAIYDSNFYTDSTPYIPGESALSCRISLKEVDESNLSGALDDLLKAFGFALIELDKI